MKLIGTKTTAGIVRNIFGTFVVISVACSLVSLTPASYAADSGKINIGVIYAHEASQGQSMRNAAKLAAKEINQSGGINGQKINLTLYDGSADPSEGINAMRRAVMQDDVSAVIGVFSSNVALALMPWSKRLGVPLIVSGGTTTKLPLLVKKHPEKYENVFRVGITNSDNIARGVSSFAHDVLFKQLGLDTAVVLVEEAAWSTPYLDTLKEEFEKRSNLKVVEWITVPTDLKDFTSIYSRIAKTNADVIITGFAYAGLTPTAQWAKMRPTPYIAGVSSKVTGGGFYERSGGAAESVMSWVQGSDAPITSKTKDFVAKYVKAFDEQPLFTGFATYDAFYFYKKAVESIGTTEPSKVVDALKRTDHVGVVGHIKLGDLDSRYPHDTKYGEDLVSGVVIQWQNGSAETIWPKADRTAKIQKAGSE